MNKLRFASVLFLAVVVGSPVLQAQNSNRDKVQRITSEIAYQQAAVTFDQQRIDLVNEEKAALGHLDAAEQKRLDDAKQTLAADKLTLQKMKEARAELAR